MSCPDCARPVQGPDRFCESCGSPLDGGSGPGHYRETDLGLIAAVSDRGRQRGHNDDAFAIGAIADRLLAVVCDGVATTTGGGQAADAAARTALGFLTGGLASSSNWPDLALQAVASAQDAFAPGSVAASHDGSTTLTLVLARTGEIVVANVGDSRAYWIGGDGMNLLLSVDDSWPAFAAAAGYPESVVRDPSRAHEITAWLGPDAGVLAPHVARHRPQGEGLLVVCSDGLWNYAAEPDALGDWVSQSGDGSPVAVARHLVQAAVNAGGADNVTVAVLAQRPERDSTCDKGGVDGQHV